MEIVSETVSSFIGAVAGNGSEGIAILSLLIFVYLVNKGLKVYQDVESNHQKAYGDLKSSIKESTKATKEMSEYLRLRNGSMEKTLEHVTQVVENFRKK